METEQSAAGDPRSCPYASSEPEAGHPEHQGITSCARIEGTATVAPIASWQWLCGWQCETHFIRKGTFDVIGAIIGSRGKVIRLTARQPGDSVTPTR
jgi:hypothetical protein